MHNFLLPFLTRWENKLQRIVSFIIKLQQTKVYIKPYYTYSAERDGHKHCLGWDYTVSSSVLRQMLLILWKINHQMIIFVHKYMPENEKYVWSLGH